MGDIPDTELTTILERRCAIAPSYAAKLIVTMRELQRRRQARPPARLGDGTASLRPSGAFKVPTGRCHYYFAFQLQES